MNPSLLTLLFAASLAAEATKGPAMIKADNEPPGQNRVTITVKGDKRIIESNGIPDHKVAQYPTRGNPNAISEQKYHLEVPANPKPLEGGAIGRMMSAWGWPSTAWSSTQAPPKSITRATGAALGITRR